MALNFLTLYFDSECSQKDLLAISAFFLEAPSSEEIQMCGSTPKN